MNGGGTVFPVAQRSPPCRVKYVDFAGEVLNPGFLPAQPSMPSPPLLRRISRYSRLPISQHPEIEETLVQQSIRNTIGAAAATVLAFVAIATALVIAAVNPVLAGPAIAVAAGMCIGSVALAVTIAAAVVWQLRLPGSNDAWIFW